MNSTDLARSRRLVTALLAVCPEFRERRPEWWTSYYGRPFDCQCNQCTNAFKAMSVAPKEHLNPPDLLAPAHLADLFEVCDALFSNFDLCAEKGASDRLLPLHKVNAWDSTGRLFSKIAMTRPLALFLAAEAALGCGEDATHA